ncbi:hypothetical protein SARC_04438 [Sphaeroforma arctica JP610]|uniref:Uncharacterized protein n=1 Tax=Sphaeroforma arctica JP610 TaxID=667725 RepID=A0A0L0G4W8_9EUKA|nr:hypothetical protein SARC_04438 [Sphaeroforma arctica JP610]KNC83313.1 hypothetical protein SARC_04438 [Sphaeroforma arctica JP610]|eukprot:XP_014157215.1 hypothetical protein SARC_04438 [Sphaeroforma arctica JP610]
MPFENHLAGAENIWNEWTAAIDLALRDEAEDDKRYDDCLAGAPVFKNLALNSQEMVCSILNTGFNIRYADSFTLDSENANRYVVADTNAYFINQGIGGSCGVVGVATMLADST